jgi:multidrug efflux pump subunit AcrA (membrane-fusion protein)
MKRSFISALAFLLGTVCAALWTDQASADKRVALVVGNSAYQNVPALKDPVNDAEAIASMFQKVGFTVYKTTNVSNLDFKRALRRFEDATTDADISVVYYSGHGIEIHGINYLIPVDAKLAYDADAEDEAVTLERLVASVSGAKRLSLVLLDACRDNPFTATMKRRSASPQGTSSGLAYAQPTAAHILIAYAAKAGEASIDDGNSDQSVFAAALLNNLFIPGLDIRLALGRVRGEVLRKTNYQQEPFVYGSLGGGILSLAPDTGEKADYQLVEKGEKVDYQLVEKIGTKAAWQIFVAQHPTGSYSDLAKQQLAKLVALEDQRRADAETANVKSTADLRGSDHVGKSPQDRSVPAPQAPSVPAIVVKATNACFASTVRFTGLVVPRAEAIINLNGDGYQISEILVKEGDTVTAGQALAKLTRLSNSAASSGQSQSTAAAGQQPATMSLTSPVAGLVSKSTAKVGAVASPLPLPPPMGPEPLFRIIVGDTLEVEADVPSADLPKMKDGELARIRLDNGHEEVGRVRTILPEIDSKTQLGKVRLTMESDSATRGGMFARGTIDATHSCGVSIPRAAVQYQTKGTTVQVVRETTVETRRVRLGLMSDERVEVIDGVKDGELVIANAGSSLLDGDQVKPELANELGQGARQ